MDMKTLQQAMIAAMKAKEKERKDVISGLIAAVRKSLSTRAVATIFRRAWSIRSY